MKNYDSVSYYLTEYCDDYLRDCGSGIIEHPNEKIYNMCADYLLSAVDSQKYRETLINFFLNRK